MFGISCELFVFVVLVMVVVSLSCKGIISVCDVCCLFFELRVNLKLVIVDIVCVYVIGKLGFFCKLKVRFVLDLEIVF